MAVLDNCSGGVQGVVLTCKTYVKFLKAGYQIMVLLNSV